MEQMEFKVVDSQAAQKEILQMRDKYSFSRPMLDLLDQRKKRPFSKEAVSETNQLKPRDLFLYQIQEITYEEKAPSREAIENVLGAFRGVVGLSFIYMILGDKHGVQFYLGVAKDQTEQHNSLGMEINDIGTQILERTLKGNFRGCRLKKLDADDKQDILEKLAHPAFAGIMEGVPSIERNSHSMPQEIDYQGTDRLIDVMSGGTFGYVVIARPYTEQEMDRVEQDIYEVYDLLVPLAKKTVQFIDNSQANDSSTDIQGRSDQRIKGSSKSENTNENRTTSENDTSTRGRNSARQNSKGNSGNTQKNHTQNCSYEEGESKRECESLGAIKSETTGYQDNESYSFSYSENETRGQSTAEVHGWSHGKTDHSSHNISINHSKQIGETNSQGEQLLLQLPVEQRKAAEWCKYLEEVLLPRLDNGRGKGLFLSCAYLFVNDYRANLYRLANTAISLFSGTKGNRTPLRFWEFPMKKECGEGNKFWERTDTSYAAAGAQLANLQLPVLSGAAIGFMDELGYTVKAEDPHFVGSWLSSDELGILTGFPQKEVIGLKLRKEVDFGLNVEDISDDENRIELGNLVQCGEEKTPIYLDRRELDKHVFIAGTTGSGKTTTCQNILLDCGLPFLVIEPVKSEYRILKNKCPDIIYFTPGNQKVAPFFLNPFELFPGESICSRAEMLKATMEASFHMEAAIPQILEAAIYKAYEKKGWDIDSDTWKGKTEKDADGPFSRDTDAFPTFSDFAKAVEEEVESKGFDERLRDEYMGTIKAMTDSLLIGSKGQMLNTPKSVSFYDLVNRKVVIELDAIKTGSEKSLLMGFILTSLMAAVKARHEEAQKRGKRFQHITLVEEAHRLLSKYMPGDSLNRKQGVEVFADMLAEVRKYGESMIIVDQIPDKMTPEVLKNTNTKIVHKLFAQDDKEAIGNTMALDNDQKAFLSNLVAGRAIVFSQGWSKAVQVQVKQETDTTGQEISDGEIRLTALNYYSNSETVQSGVLFYLRKATVTPEMAELYFNLLRNKKQGGQKLNTLCKEKISQQEWHGRFSAFLQEFLPYKSLGADTLGRIYLPYAKVYRNTEELEEFIGYILDRDEAQAFEVYKKKYLIEIARKIFKNMTINEIQDFNNMREALQQLLADLGLDGISRFLYSAIYDEEKICSIEGEKFNREAKKEMDQCISALLNDEKADSLNLKQYRMLMRCKNAEYIKNAY